MSKLNITCIGCHFLQNSGCPGHHARTLSGRCEWQAFIESGFYLRALASSDDE